MRRQFTCSFLIASIITLLFSALIPASARAGTIHHYEYVLTSGFIYVYDLDNGGALVKRVSVPTTAGTRGAVASAATGMLYISYGSDGNNGGFQLAYNLSTDQVVWTMSYSHGIDSQSVSPDGKTIYMPEGELASGGTWYVEDSSTGNDIGSIATGGFGPHNTIVSPNGLHVYMGDRDYNLSSSAPGVKDFNFANTATNQIIGGISPLKSGARPFTINSKETFSFNTVTHFLGFQVGDLTTGKVLYTVAVDGSNIPGYTTQTSATIPSHGISLSPDDKEIYLVDQPNSYVHVFDVSGLPANPPVQVADIPLVNQMAGNQSECAYDCLRDGWIQHTRDGRFINVGDSGDVIDTLTRKTIATLPAMLDSRVEIEIDFQDGTPIWAATSRSGVGYTNPQPPNFTARITSPNLGSKVSGTNVAVSTSVIDSVSIASVDLYVDGALYASTTSSPYSFSWDSTKSVNGTHTLMVTANDTAGNTTSFSANFNVNNVVVNPPSVTTASLSNGTQNAAYSANLAATGGTTPYMWSIISGGLPAGLTLAPGTGTISGTPTGTGTSSFTVQVTDANSLKASAALSVTINAGGGGASIALVQSNAIQGSGVSSVSAAFATGNIAGNLIIAFVRMSSTGQTVTVADSGGNMYTEAVAQTQTADGHQVHIFYARKIVGGANTVKAAFSATNNHPWLAIYEYSGISKTNPLDQTAHAQGSSAAVSSGATAMTVSANELVFAGTGMPASYTGKATAGSGYAMLQQGISTSPAGNEGEVVNSTGTYTAAFTLSSSTSWSVVLATFAAVGAASGPPAVTTTSLANGTQNTLYSATLAGTGGTPPYTWSIISGGLPVGLTLAPGTGTISGTPRGTGTSSFTVQVTDANALAATKALSLTVGAALTVTTASLANGTQNTAYSATLAATGGMTPYAWSIASGNLPAGLTLASGTGTISGTPSGTGTSSFTVQVTDANALAATKALSLTVGAALTVTTTSLANGTQNTAYSATLAATGGMTPYAWSIASGNLPAGLTLASGTGTISGTPSGTGTSSFTVQVTDANALAATKALSLTVGAALTVTTTSLANGTQNTAYSATLAATGGTTPYAWSIASGNLPAGLTLASGTGTISGTPSGTGTSSFTVQVTDANALAATKALSLTVGAALTVTTTSLANGTQNTAYSATLAATGGMTPYAWSIASGNLPAGLTLAPGTGIISGTPTGTGTSSFTAQVTDANSLVATKVLSVTVGAVPTITTTSLANGTQNAAYSATLAATGGTTPYTWSIISGSLPAGLTLAPGTGTISGTPTGTGTSSFTVQVTDANSLKASAALSVTINAGGGGASIALVQSNAIQGSGVSSVSAAFATGNTAGNLIIAFVRMSSTGQTVTVTDSGGNMYTEAVAQTQTADGHQVHIFYARKIVGGANTVKTAFSATNNHPWLAIYEYSGISKTNPLDQTAHAQGSSAAVSSGATAMTVSANELVFAGTGMPASYTGKATAGSGYAMLQQDTSTSPAANEGEVVNSTGTYAAPFTLSPGANWTVVLATFKP